MRTEDTEIGPAAATPATPPVWTDVHCHLGDYPDASRTVADAGRAGVTVFGSTVLPSEYLRLRELEVPVMGLGFHPMHADLPDLSDELGLYEDAADGARWLSEIGLDGWMPVHADGPSLARQEALLSSLFARGVGDKVLSLHARDAERRCAEMVIAARPGAAVFHWYKGDLDVARMIVDAGMLFSVNPMMVADPGRAEFLRWAPVDALLLETDGPQPRADSPATVFPADLPATAKALARMRGMETADLARSMRANLARLPA